MPTEPLAPPPMPSAVGRQMMLSKGAGNAAADLGRMDGEVDDMLSPVQSARPPFNTETYDHISDNPFMSVANNPLSTFSIDVDTAAYANMRRWLRDGALPPKDAVRIEELVNYFPYAYAGPTDAAPFATHVEVASAPWQPSHRLVRVALKGKVLPRRARPHSNFVFLIDVSGSMEDSNKLPLLKQSLRLLTQQLTADDHVAMVVYAGASGTVLPSTPGNQKGKILAALDHLEAGGSTNGGEGIQLAYRTALNHFIQDGNNRVILATDGDFNVGVTNNGDLVRLIEAKAKSGVFLSVLGFGEGNLNDAGMEKLADKGNGNYAYIDSLNEARKVLVKEMHATLNTIAKDVKIQVEFNPTKVAAYRLIGYENRALRNEDFNDDTKDAGEIGEGHTVTAFYDVVPVGVPLALPGVDPLKYQTPPVDPTAATTNSGELLTVKLRYKEPAGSSSQLIDVAVTDGGQLFEQATEDFRFAASVAGFGMLLRESPHLGTLTFDAVAQLAARAKGNDPDGYRQEFLQLVTAAKRLTMNTDAPKGQ
ncbi:MAG: VWA domain-containing protein [Deltaproteobacteria bacterium]|nr:VWA domain-containing protein [Deltaproteobacteria bacterium]